MFEHFQDQDWIRIPHETFVIVVIYFSDSFHKNPDLFLGR